MNKTYQIENRLNGRTTKYFDPFTSSLYTTENLIEAQKLCFMLGDQQEGRFKVIEVEI